MGELKKVVDAGLEESIKKGFIRVPKELQGKYICFMKLWADLEWKATYPWINEEKCKDCFGDRMAPFACFRGSDIMWEGNDCYDEPCNVFLEWLKEDLDWKEFNILQLIAEIESTIDRIEWHHKMTVEFLKQTFKLMRTLIERNKKGGES